MRSEINLTRPRLADGLVLIFLVVITVLSPRFLPAGQTGKVLIVKTPELTREIPLDVDGRYPVSGPLGKAFIVVEKGRARMENAPCPLKLCESMGPIDHAGQVIVCLPNRIAVSIPGPEEVDAISR